MGKYAGCHDGKGIICLDEANSSAPCNKDHTKCEWAKYPDIIYIFKAVVVKSESEVAIPSNAIGINTNADCVSWLEPTRKTKAIL